jgi:ankyrin repeat protein
LTLIFGATALHLAAYCRRDKLVQKLIEKGAKFNQRDTSFNGTSLDWAVHILRSGDIDNLFHQTECIKLLIIAAAELTNEDRECLKSINFYE